MESANQGDVPGWFLYMVSHKPKCQCLMIGLEAISIVVGTKNILKRRWGNDDLWYCWGNKSRDVCNTCRMGWDADVSFSNWLLGFDSICTD